MSRQTSSVTGGKENFTPVTIRKTRSGSSTSAKPSKKLEVAKSMRIVLRIKADEHAENENLAIQKNHDGKYQVLFKDEHAFAFDNALPPEASQEDTYKAVMENGVEHCLSGYRVCVMAYGQTGSGKTYSITGVEDKPGILPLFADNLFEKIRNDKLENNVFVSLCFYEIYQEKIYDLLAAERKALRVRGGDDTHIAGLIEVGVQEREELERWRRIGLSRRATAATMVNDLSSRSHAIFRIKVQREENLDGESKIYKSSCFFVDLAGSESIAISGDHLITETACINKSLLALQRVVDARSSNASFVGYRDSLLTRLLKDCFSGNSLTTLLATVSPREIYAAETLRTLRFSSKAAKIIQTPCVIEVNDGESVAALKEENELYARKIAEMTVQLENMKHHSAIVDKIQAPSVLELFSDDSLNRWTSLENGLQFGLGENEALIEFLLKDTKWHVRSLNDHVYVDGKQLPFEESTVLCHGSIVSLFGQRFFALFLDAKCDPRKFITYDGARLQHLTATFELEKHLMNEQILKEAKESEKQLRDALEKEVNDLRSKLKALQKKSTSNPAKPSVKKECETLENDILVAEEVQNNLTTALKKEAQAFTSENGKVEETEEEKQLTLDLHGKIAMMNHLLDITGKSKTFMFRASVNNTVRIFNRRNKVFALFSREELLELSERFSNIYQSGGTKAAMTIEIERIIYSSSFIWRPLRPGADSSLLQTAVFNSLQETARKRRSTFAEVSQGFSNRRSVIADVIQQQAAPVDLLEDFLRQVTLYAAENRRNVDSEDELNQLTEVGIMLNACGTARKCFEGFIAPQHLFSTTSVQKKALSLVSLFRSLSSLDVISTTAQLEYLNTEVSNLGFEYIMKEILERTNLLRKLVDEWINSIRNDTLCGNEGSLIISELDHVIECLGKFSFFLGKKGQCSDASILQPYRSGVCQAIKEFTGDVEQILQTCAEEKTTKSRLRKLAATFVFQLTNYSAKSYDEEFMFEVLRKAIFIKENVMTCSEEQAGKLAYKIDDLIYAATHLESPIDPNIVRNLEDGYILWQNLARAAAKPPRPPLSARF